MVRAVLRQGLVVALVAAWASSVGTLPASAGRAVDDNADGGVVVTTVPAPERRAARAYWTPARMAAAPALDKIVGGSAPAPLSAENFIADRIKKPYTIPNKRRTGVVFGTIPPSFDFRCSGTALDDLAGGAIVWTAGHCVFNAPYPYRDDDDCDVPEDCPAEFGAVGEVQNLVFVPGMHSGPGMKKPFGKFVANAQASPIEYETTGNFRFDFSAFTVGTNNQGQTLAQAVGGRDFITGYDAAPTRQFKATGYPVLSPFDGNSQWKCPSRLKGRDTFFDAFETEKFGAPLPGEDPMEIKCDMTGGSSGGGWRTSGAVGSNVSYGYGSLPDRLFGPYLGAEAQALFDSLSGA